ncbi:chemotaxis protein CheW [Desulfococcaceae bacterium HSG8]|nr:chemotaxis protein CheW [Desulfococcaceae bacterium HSG8]
MSEKKNREIVEDDFYDDEDEDTQKDKYLTFQLSSEVYGIEIYHVIEIVGMQKITEVPDMPGFVKGVINLRGQVIPVMDVRTRFCMKQREYDDRTCVIVISIEDTTIGLAVDTVNEVADIPESNVSPPPKIGKGISSRYIRGMGKTEDDVKILLDVNRLLFDEELVSLSNASVSQ